MRESAHKRPYDLLTMLPSAQVSDLDRYIEKLEAAYEGLRSRIADLEKNCPWHSIETAPKDGTWFIGRDGDVTYGVPFPPRR